MREARIINIERCSTEDGPGIRTTVFLKGCKLRCKWCSNPESQSFISEILFKGVRCIGCNKCIEKCPSDAIYLDKEFGMITNPAKCSHCKVCVENCYVDARVVQGEDYTVSELMDILERDGTYYETSGGGITFSGGEPLLYPEFIKECAHEIHEKGWTVLVETCGFIPRENLEAVAGFVDIIYCDYKHWNPDNHKALTGEDNRQILDNIRWLSENFTGELSLRYPFIPGCNDKPEDVEKFLQFAEGLGTVKDVVFLPYHRLGLDKYKGLGRRYEMGDMPSLRIADIQYLKDYEKEYDLNIAVY
jgi:pyruvate formate lyase activating enzyme